MEEDGTGVLVHDDGVTGVDCGKKRTEESPSGGRSKSRDAHEMARG